MEQYFLGMDNGGTVIKAALFDERGRQIAVSSRKTPVFTPHPDYQERDMEDLWLQNCACVRSVLEKSGIDSRQVAGVAVCGHGKGLYLWGVQNAPIRPAIASTDLRARAYPARWKQQGIHQRLYPQLCQDLIPCQQAALLAWVKDHEPDVYQSIRWVFSVKDYIRFRLTGEAFSEETDLSGSGLMDVAGERVDPALLEALGIGEMYDKIPPLRHSFDLCGSVTAQAAQLTGLAEGTPVAGGMFDIDACAIAMDITAPGRICTITGTWSINETIMDTPCLDWPAAMRSRYAIPGYFLLEECSPTSAGNLEWVLSNMAGLPGPAEGQNKYDWVNAQVASLSPEDCPVYFLPFLYGSNSHSFARGTFLGLTSAHTSAHLLRAVYEGTAYSHKVHIQRLQQGALKTAPIRMAGGAANSLVWAQMFADVLDAPIERVQGVQELGALGCAMAAAVAVGRYPDYASAAKAMVRVDNRITPNPELVPVYRRKFETYQLITQSLFPVWDRLQEEAKE